MAFDLKTNFDGSVQDMVQAIVTVLAVINPVVCGAIFLILTPKLAPQERRWTSRQSGTKHSGYSGYLRARWSPSFANIWHFIGRIPDRRRDDHCIYGT